jgi:DNA-binding NarL/FixJ family response regulator
MKETLLAPGGKMPAILADLHTHLTNNRHYSAASMVGQLRAAWRVKYTQILDGAGRKRTATAKTKLAGRGRRVTPYIVRQIYLLLQKGHKKTEIAKALQISLGVVQQVSANTYKLDSESRAAWWETFGANPTQQSDFEGPKSPRN